MLIPSFPHDVDGVVYYLELAQWCVFRVRSFLDLVIAAK